MTITKEQLAKIAPNLKEPKLSVYVDALNATMATFKIASAQATAMFIAQLMHESAECRYTKELASGEAYDTGSLAVRLGNTPEDDDDGRRYKGRGLIQITGTDNYKQLSKYFGVDFVKTPELLEQPEWAAKSAGWYWNSRKLNTFVGQGTLADFKVITKKINGGYNGLEDRVKYWTRAKSQYGIK